MLRLPHILPVFGFLAVLAPAAPVAAQGIDGVVRLDILPGWRQDDGRHMAGIRLTLAPGWKTYWRAPGDAGIPPLFDWQGSDNLRGAAFHWPTPEVSWQNGLRSIGYEGQVTIPVEFDLADPAAPARMAGRVQIGVCEEVCVPVDLEFRADLPAGPTDGRRDPAIVAALVDRPMTAAEAGAGPARCAVSAIDGGMRLSATLPLPPRHMSEDVVIETGDPEVWVSEPEVRVTGGTLTAESDLVHIDGGSFAIDRSAVRFTVLGAAGAVDILGCSAG